MSNWRVSDVLDQIQELVGEPAGAYYNISNRLNQLNQAQREMVEDSRAIHKEIEIPTEIGKRTYILPDNFLTYSKVSPFYKEASNNVYLLKVVDTGFMDIVLPGWQKDSPLPPTGKPQYIVMTGVQEFELHPASSDPTAKIVINYVVDPPALTDLTDEIFAGHTSLNRFGYALALKVAAMYMMPRSPQLGQQYLGQYNAELRKMRALVRSNPQHPQTLRPRTYPRGRRKE